MWQHRDVLLSLGLSPVKSMSLSNHKWQMIYLSVDTFQMEHMETTPTHPHPPTHNHVYPPHHFRQVIAMSIPVTPQSREVALELKYFLLHFRNGTSSTECRFLWRIRHIKKRKEQKRKTYILILKLVRSPPPFPTPGPTQRFLSIKVFWNSIQRANWANLPNLPKGMTIAIGQFRGHVYKHDQHEEFSLMNSSCKELYKFPIIHNLEHKFIYQIPVFW